VWEIRHCVCMAVSAKSRHLNILKCAFSFQCDTTLLASKIWIRLGGGESEWKSDNFHSFKNEFTTSLSHSPQRPSGAYNKSTYKSLYMFIFPCCTNSFLPLSAFFPFISNADACTLCHTYVHVLNFFLSKRIYAKMVQKKCRGKQAGSCVTNTSAEHG
jgi:hypothetical protein